MVVDAPDTESARIMSERANMLSPRISLVQPTEQVDRATIMVFDPAIPPKPGRDMLRERPVITIALGVFLGLLMFAALVLLFVALGSFDNLLRG